MSNGEARSGRPPRSGVVLVVDDEPLNLQVFEYNFAELFEFRFAPDAARALEILRSERVAVVIADHRMPGMLGLDLLALVAEEQPQVVRVLLTAHTDVPLLMDAVNRGVLFRYIAKPWDADAMAQDIRLALARHVQEAELRRLLLSATEQGHPPDHVAAALQFEAGDLAERLRRVAGQPEVDEVVRRLELLRNNAARVANRHSSSWSTLDARALANTAIAAMRPRLEQGGVVVEVEGSAPILTGARDRLVEALVALLANAVQAVTARPGPRVIRVTIREQTGGVRLAVNDGYGFPATRAAELFYSETGGCGLGLAVVAAVARQHGGRLDTTESLAGEVAIVLPTMRRGL